jgi:hypothetical protein
VKLSRAHLLSGDYKMEGELGAHITARGLPATRRQSVQNSLWDNIIPVFFMIVFIVVLVFLGITHH